jgi:SAM-dependent methyltransferase
MTTSAYAEMHKADWVPTHYDTVIYDPAGYDTFIWGLQQRVLRPIVQRLASKHATFKYLDFACGTGRIVSAFQDLATEAVALDVSPQMAARAATRTPDHVVVKSGDLLEIPELADADYDLITAFRFFLNTEPDMRPRVMRALAERLHGREARLMFNIHGNAWSSVAFKLLYQRLRGWGRASQMSYPAVRRLVADAGLEIESVHGFGLAPYRLYRSPVGLLVRHLDKWAVGKPGLRWISHDLVFVCRRAG